MEPNKVAWLDEWRARKKEILQRDIPLSVSPFGIVQAPEHEIVEWLNSATPSALMVMNATPLDRERLINAAKATTQASIVSYSSAVTADKSQITPLGNHFPTWSAMANKRVRDGKSVILISSGMNDFYAYVQRMAEGLFYNGARAVAVYDPSTLYEYEWEKDGLTGVFWPEPR